MFGLFGKKKEQEKMYTAEEMRAEVDLEKVYWRDKYLEVSRRRSMDVSDYNRLLAKYEELRKSTRSIMYDLDKVERKWFRIGFDQAVKKGHTGNTKGIDKSKLNRLISLCHPDKHGNSAKANEITKWLLEQR